MNRAPVDVRLAIGAGGAWLALVLCHGHPVRVIGLVTVVAMVTGVVAVVAGRRAAVLPPVGLTCFCVALVLVPYAGRLAQARASPLAALAGLRASVTAELTVADDPHILAGKGLGGSPRVAVDTEATAMAALGRRRPLSGSVLVLGPAAPWSQVLPAQRVTVEGTLQPSLDPGDLGVVLFSDRAPTLLGRPPWWQRAAGRVRDSLRAAVVGLPAAERGLLPGLIDGDTSGLDPVLVERFRVSGLTHLVAVSGTNCSILVGALLLVLRRMRVRPWLCAVLGGVVLVAFVIVARPSPSVLRAAVMASIALVSLAVGRPRQAVAALAVAVLALLVCDPFLAEDAGFSMSVLATGALLLLAPQWADTMRRHRVPAGVAEALAVAAAAHLVTAPVVAAISGRISLVAVAANALAEPAVAAATVLGFLAAVIAPFWLAGAVIAAQLAGWPCRWLVGVADRLGSLEGAVLPWPGGTAGGLALLGVSAALVLLARQGGPGRLVALGVVVAALVQIPVRSVAPGWPPSGWLLIACDVGQGDAVLLAAGHHSVVEFDAGPDPVAVDRCLRDADVDTVALLAFTHFHLDHVGGILGVLHGRRVGRVLTGPLLDPVGGVQLVDDALHAHGLRRAAPSTGSTLDVGDVHLDVLGPSSTLHGTRSDPNNSSLVIRATIHGTRLLMPGDAEVEAQRALLDSGVDLRADVLKVPHHGSAYSDPAFLAAVHARIGVISVGRDNDYGHPSPLLLEAMARLGVPVRRTDYDGDVAVVGTGATLSTVVRGASAVPAAMGSVAADLGPAGVRLPAQVEQVTQVTQGARRVAARSVGGAKMTTCPAALSASTSCPTRLRRSSCSSATKSFSSVARSARSPPRSGDARVRSTNPSAPAQRSRGRSCTNCSGRPCSARPDWW